MKFLQLACLAILGLVFVVGCGTEQAKTQDSTISSSDVSGAFGSQNANLLSQVNSLGASASSPSDVVSPIDNLLKVFGKSLGNQQALLAAFTQMVDDINKAFGALSKNPSQDDVTNLINEVRGYMKTFMNTVISAWKAQSGGSGSSKGSSS